MAIARRLRGWERLYASVRCRNTYSAPDVIVLVLCVVRVLRVPAYCTLVHQCRGKPVRAYSTAAVSRHQATGATAGAATPAPDGFDIHWRNVATAVGASAAVASGSELQQRRVPEGVYYSPTADVLMADGAWVSVRRYNHPVLREK